MTEQTEGAQQTDRQQTYRDELRLYIWGYVLALLLTLLPFGLVYGNVPGRTWVLLIIAVCALAQMVVHFRFFLHISLHHQREDLHLILFSALVVALMVAGTLWIMVNLAVRMAPGMPMAGAGM